MINRIVRFIIHESTWWFLAPGVIALATWRYSKIVSPITVASTGLVIFLATRLMVPAIVLRYHKLKQYLQNGAFVMLAAAFLLQFRGFHTEALIVASAYLTLWFGIIFWTASDSMYDLVNWLSFPTEYGRPPDEIRLFDKRTIAWPDEDRPIECRLYRYRYEDEWECGLTGPTTFSLCEALEGKTADQIYDAYREWYTGCNIAEKLDRAANND